jgi:hypothetical protein
MTFKITLITKKNWQSYIFNYTYFSKKKQINKKQLQLVILIAITSNWRFCKIRKMKEKRDKEIKEKKIRNL